MTQHHAASPATTHIAESYQRRLVAATSALVLATAPCALDCSSAHAAAPPPLSSTAAAVQGSGALLLAPYSAALHAALEPPGSACAAAECRGVGDARTAGPTGRSASSGMGDLAGLFSAQSIDEEDPVDPFTLYGTVLYASSCSRHLLSNVYIRQAYCSTVSAQLGFEQCLI